MKAEYEVTAHPGKRQAYVRMSGIFTEKEMTEVATEFLNKVDRAFRGHPFMLVADMRGLRTLTPAVAKIMGEFIGKSRQKGVTLCAHVSDETVQRLQAQRIARQNSRDDTITVDCASLEEAQRVCEEARPFLDDPAFRVNARLALDRAGAT